MTHKQTRKIPFIDSAKVKPATVYRLTCTECSNRHTTNDYRNVTRCTWCKGRVFRFTGSLNREFWFNVCDTYLVHGIDDLEESNFFEAVEPV